MRLHRLTLQDTAAVPGKLILANTETYLGGTVISSGTLQIGNGGTTGSFVGSSTGTIVGVTDDGILAFDRSDPITYAGPITGSGGLTLMAGAVTLTGAVNLSGVTTLGAGLTINAVGNSSLGTATARQFHHG